VHGIAPAALRAGLVRTSVVSQARRAVFVAAGVRARVGGAR
jgi:hypothetical protein